MKFLESELELDYRPRSKLKGNKNTGKQNIGLVTGMCSASYFVMGIAAKISTLVYT